MAAPPTSPVPALPFEVWMERLRTDCKAKNKMAAFDALGAYVLRVLWSSGLEPTCEAIETQDGIDDRITT